MFAQILSRNNDVTRACDWKAMCAGLLQRQRHLFASTMQQQWSNCFNGLQAHSSGSSCGENAEDEFFPQPRIRTFLPDCVELDKSFSNFLSSRVMRGANAFNCNGRVMAHFDLSISRF